MSYDPTQWAPPPDGQPPQGPPPQPPAAPPAFGQSNPGWAPTQQASAPAPAYNPSAPAWSPAPQAPTQQAAVPPPAYGQSNPSLPPYGQVPQAPATPPAYGQSNPSLPPYEQIPPVPASAGAYNQYAPADPYAPAPGLPYQPGLPPTYPPAVPPKKSNLKGILIAVIIIVLLAGGGGGTAIYLATRPQPTISVTSQYSVGATPAGSTSTTFTVSGKDFSGNSAVTFLLDNAPVPGSQTAQSDSKGDITVTLTVTDGWSVGNHTITAKDAGGYLTKVGKQITIVAQGQAKTPGPNGAPTDSASGTIDVSVQTGGQAEQTTLNITGSANGGTVCASDADGQPHSHTGFANGMAYTETIVKTCSGTYKSGKIDYTETTTTDKITFDNGAVCSTNAPFVNAHLVGTFSSATEVSGTFSEDQITLTCTLDGQSQSNNVDAQTGTWTGNASMQ